MEAESVTDYTARILCIITPWKQSLSLSAQSRILKFTVQGSKRQLRLIAFKGFTIAHFKLALWDKNCNFNLQVELCDKE